MSLLQAKRFYKTVTVAPEEEAFGVQLDNRPIRTPAKNRLALPTKALAEAVAAEWDAQEDKIEPASMPLTRLAYTALDQIEAQREAAVEAVLAFAETELLCYRVEEPAELAARQRTHWQPVLDWARLHFDAPLQVTYGIMPRPQPAEALSALRQPVDALDGFRLTALQVLVHAAHSLVLPLALLEGQINAQRVWELSTLEEAYQIEQWGEDAEARQRREALQRDILAAGRFVPLLSRSSL